MAAISDNLKYGGGSPLCGDNVDAEKLVRRVTILSSWKREFVCVSQSDFVDGVPTGELSDDEYALLCDTVSAFVKRSEGSVFLADFEGEMPGWAGELTCAQFLTTQAVKGGGEADPLVRNVVDAKDEASTTAAPAALAPPGLLIDLRSKRGFALVKEIMENEAIAKLIWGADGDLTSLRYPVKTMGGGAAEGIEAKNAVDVQLGYSTAQRRLGMARMLSRLPEAATKGLPAKAAAVDFDTNKRAMQYPMQKDLCMYAVDDLHRIDAILRTQDPYGGTYEHARIATRSFQHELSQPSHALRWFCYEMGYFSRKYGLKRKTKAVEFARAFHHIRAVFKDRLSEGDERTLIHHFTEVSRVLEEEGIVVKEDLSFN